jgi:MoxR-like ATPase
MPGDEGLKHEVSNLPEDTEAVVKAGEEARQATESTLDANTIEAERIRDEELGEAAEPEIVELHQIKSQTAEVAQAFETRVERMSSPYVISPELEKTLRVSRILNKPLLLEGEPGTGKTSLAYALSGEEDTPIIHCRGKSTLSAQSVMYEIDYVARLNDASLSQAIPEAMRADAERWSRHIEEGGSADDAGFQSFMTGFERAAKLLNIGKVSDVRNYITYGELGEAITRAASGEKVILLFDEIDKAKRDFPNDLLDELEHMTMRVRETGQEISAPKENITVVITSNHERDLPEPFLRRCVYSYLEFPKPAHMTEIVKAHLPDVDENLLRSAVSRFYEVRSLRGIQKEPSTSEMLDWMKVLIAMGVEDVNGSVPFPETLVKIKEDLDIVRKESGNDYPSDQELAEYEYLEVYKMEKAAYEAIHGSLVFRLEARGSWGRDTDLPRSELYALLANEGYQFTAPNEDEHDSRQVFSIDEPGFTRLSGNVFALKPPEGLDKAAQEKWMEKSKRLYDLMLQGGYVKTQFTVSEEPRKFSQVAQSNELFVKGTDESGQVFYKTKDGKYVYEEPVQSSGWRQLPMPLS